MEVKEPQNIKELRLEIMVQIRDLAKLLGMMPNDDKIVEDARYSFHGAPWASPWSPKSYPPAPTCPPKCLPAVSRRYGTQAWSSA